MIDICGTKFRIYDKIDKVYFDNLRDLTFDKEGKIASVCGVEYEKNGSLKSASWRKSGEFIIEEYYGGKQ